MYLLRFCPPCAFALQEQKYRRQQQLDGMPAWTPACEELLAMKNAQAVCGACFAGVK